MKELLDILKQTINFMEKYKVFSISGELKVLKDFFGSQEEMNTAFYYRNHYYNVSQIWTRDACQNHYVFTIYCDGKETDIDMSFIRTVYDVLSQKYDDTCLK